VSLVPNGCEVLPAMTSGHLHSLELSRPLVYLEFSMVWEMMKGLEPFSGEASREVNLSQSPLAVAAQVVCRWVQRALNSHALRNP